MVVTQRMRSAAYRTAIGLVLVAIVLIAATEVASAWKPFLFTRDTGLFISYFALLAAAISLLVLSTTPWKFLGGRRFARELSSFWKDHHWGRIAAGTALAFAFASGILFGMAKGIGGNYSYYQFGKHFFETGGDCNHCPSWVISRSTYVAKIRALGIIQSTFFLIGGLLMLYLGAPLRALKERGEDVSDSVGRQSESV